MLEWENMCKAYVKAKTVIEKEGIPSFYIKSLAELEDFVQNVCMFVCSRLLCVPILPLNIVGL